MKTFHSNPLSSMRLNLKVRCECGCNIDHDGQALSTRGGATPEGYKKEKIQLTCNSCSKTMSLYALVEQ